MADILLHKVFKINKENFLNIPLPENFQGEVEVEVRNFSTNTNNKKKVFDAIELAGLQRFFSEKDDEYVDWEEVFGVKGR